MILHVPTFSLAAYASQDSPWHRLQPRVRLILALLLVLGVTLIPNGAWVVWGLYAALMLTLLLVSQVSVLVILQRITVEFLFVSVLLLTILFGGRGEALYNLGPLVIADQSLVAFLSVMCKALLSLWMLNLLTLTTAAPNLLQALAGLGCPALLVRILESMLRYVAVLIDELGSMRRAAEARAKPLALLRWDTLGNLLGALFLRTYGRGERVYQAMQARGFKGEFPGLRDKPLNSGEWSAVVGTVLFVVGTVGTAWWSA